MLRLPPQHKPHATFMQPLQCVSQHHVANLHVSTHMATPDDTFQCDLQPQIPKHPITTHAQAHPPKQLEATATMRQKKKANRPQPQPPHTGGTFHRRLQPLDTEKHKFLCSGFLPNANPMQHSCSHYNVFRSITSQTCTYLRTWQHQMTQIMQPFQCGLQPQIPKHPITTHAQAHPKQLEATVTMRPKKKANRPQPQPPHTGGFIAGCSHLTRKNTSFCAPASSPTQAPCNIHAAITTFFAASRRKPACIYTYGNTR